MYTSSLQFVKVQAITLSSGATLAEVEAILVTAALQTMWYFSYLFGFVLCTAFRLMALEHHCQDALYTAALYHSGFQRCSGNNEQKLIKKNEVQ